jgi:MFS-type transporter involved in bile tolerance (Atg22 family)
MAAPGGISYPPRRAVAGWVMFDWAAQPFFTLITTFIFAPFFASALASDPAQGQALWGYATGAAGLAIALLSPLLGGVADMTGPRKPWIASFGALLVLGAGLLWFAVPGHPSAVPIALAGFVLAGFVGFSTGSRASSTPAIIEHPQSRRRNQPRCHSCPWWSARRTSTRRSKPKPL